MHLQVIRPLRAQGVPAAGPGGAGSGVVGEPGRSVADALLSVPPTLGSKVPTK